MLRPNKAFILLWWSYLLILSKVFAQVPNLKFKHITDEQGLSNSTIEVIYQDKRGFMWFGTRDGLNRYDGSQIITFRYDPKAKSSISDNYITCIFQDDQQRLWIGTTNGLNLFDEKKGTFSSFKYRAGDITSLSNNYITGIIQDKKKHLWISTKGGGINLYNEGRFTAYHVNYSTTLNSDNVNCIFEDNHENLWIGTDAGIRLFDRNSMSFKEVDLFKQFSGKGISVNCINEDMQGNILVGTNDAGLLIFNYTLHSIKQYTHQETQPRSLANNLVKCILIGKNNNIWIGCINGGLNLFDPVSGNFYNYQYHPNDPKSLSQRTVSALFEDKQGNLWVGTHRGGVNLYMPDTEKFMLFRQQPDNNSLSYNDVRAFCEDSFGNIWIGTDGGGLNLFHRNTNSFKHFKHNPFQKNSIGSDEVLDVMEDTQKNLWVATWGGGLCLFNRTTSTFTRFTNDINREASISSNYIQKVFEDSKNNLWVATYFGGLNLFDRKSHTFSHITYSQSHKSQLIGKNIISINEDKEGNIWIGTDDGGLNCLSVRTQEFSHYFMDDEKKPDLRIIFIDSKGNIWIGQKGLYLFDKQSNKFNLYTSQAGLSEEFIKGIVEDAEGILWISTSNGITKLNPETLAVKKFNTADGLQGLEFEANACLKTREGQIFFGGVNGFNTFYPRKITTNSFVPPVYITDFQIFNKKVLVDKKSPLQEDVSFTKELKLSYKQSTFSFGFAALNYTTSENNQYAYKLENWDKDWIYTGSEKKASYTNVSPGRYIFRVRATNNDGIWNETGTQIEIVIEPPFWDTWWFRLIVVMTVISAIVAFYNFKRRLERQQLEEQKKEEIHQQQLQFFTNISHEFRTPLSLILGPLEKLIKEENATSKRHYYDLMYRNANRLMNLINELMDFRKVESGVLKLNVMKGNLPAFLQEISDEFEDLAHEKGISFQIVNTTQLPDAWFDRQVLEKIVINLLSNSFKYIGDGKQITIEVFDSLENYKPLYANKLIIPNEYKSLQYLYLRVTDDGIGISGDSIDKLFERYYKITDSHLGSGIGLAFVKSLTMLHKGNIQVYSEKNKGTEIIIGIPSQKEDYSEKERWGSYKELSVKLESIQTKYESNLLPPKETTSPKNGYETTRQTILIVDDNDELRQFLKDSLTKSYNIIEAINGKVGLEKAKENFPDLIISDIMMPVMNGNIFCKLIKDDPETSHIPFLMLTAKDGTDAKIEGTESGADFYFSKPLSMELLELTIRNIFIQKQKLKTKYANDQLAETLDKAHSVKDKNFLAELVTIIESHLTDPDMNIDYICSQIGMSRTKLYTKIKDLTGQSISDFIRTIRLKKALQLLTEENMPIVEVMYLVGIQTQSYFTKAFKNEFGKTPMQFLKELKR
jgi:ligand-binding sensor domain-containing protein/signal transduction histidine kinase/AraC-like DNA-binding protein